MKNSKREEIVSHSAKKLFNIVLDIQSYPEYIPWCTKMIVNEKKNDEIYADMYVKYKFILTQKFDRVENVSRTIKILSLIVFLQVLSILSSNVSIRFIDMHFFNFFPTVFSIFLTIFLLLKSRKLIYD